MAFLEFTNRNQPSSGLICTGFQQLTVTVGAVSLTVPANSNYALMILDTTPIRFRLDAINPTAAIGQSVAVGDQIFISGSKMLNDMRLIRNGGADGVLNIHYFS